MRRFAIALLVIAVPATALQAQTMPVSTFLAKADALKKKGPMALLSSDLGLLKKEITGSAARLRAERLAAKQAGRRPAYCPPEKPAALATDELLAHFRSIPTAQGAQMPVQDALRSYFARKHPCPA